MKKILFTAAAGLIAIGAEAQTVGGKVVDGQRQPLPYVNVVALSLPDSAFVSGAVSGDDGTFQLDAKGKGRLLRITSMGYKTQYKPVAADLGVISMEPEARVLNEVVVKSQLPKTRLKNGGMITTVSGTILETAGTAENLLDRIPNVSAKKGEIKVFGRGTPVVYINGRQMRDKMELENLTSDNIKSVEVITAPGARYAADVTSVIRITTKKPVGEGFGFDSKTYLAYAEKGDLSGTESLNMNYRTGGFDLSAALYGSHRNSRDDKDLEQYAYLDNTWYQKNIMRQPYTNDNLYGKLALNYAFNTDNSVGASFSYDRTPKLKFSSKLDSWIYEDDVLTETSTSDVQLDSRTTELYGNAYYAGKAGKLGIDFNADWFRTTEDNPINTVERYTETGAAEQVNDVHTLSETANNLFAAKLLFTCPVLGGELGFGGEYSYSDRRTLYTALPVGLLDDDDSKIKEGMASAFVDYSRSFGRLSLQAGLRYEYVDFNYYEQGVRVAAQSRTFSNLFPSLSLSMPVGNVQMQLSYSTDVYRPSYWNLRSSITYGNRYTYETGNPFLLPQLTSNLNYALSYKWLSGTLMFIHISDPILSNGDSYNGQPEVLLLKIINGKSYNRVAASLALSPKFGLWQPSLRLGLFKQWMRMESHDGDRMNNPKATVRLDNTFDTKLCQISLMMTAQTEGGTENSFATQGYFNTDLMLYKSLCKDRLTLQLYVRDLFGTADRHLNEYFGKLRTLGYHPISRSSAMLTVRYKLNAAKSKYRGTGAGSSQRSRM